MSVLGFLMIEAKDVSSESKYLVAPFSRVTSSNASVYYIPISKLA